MQLVKVMKQLNFTANGIAFKTLEFNVGTSVAGKIFVNTSYTGGSNDGSRLKTIY